MRLMVEEVIALGAIVDVRDVQCRPNADKLAFLSAAEQCTWRAIPSTKRKLEYAAGRLACKAVVMEAQKFLNLKVLPAHELEIDRPYGTWPVCTDADGRRWRLALSHNAELAVALCSVGRFDIGVDVELLSKRILVTEEYFHASECNPSLPEHSVWRWTIKEACAKLLGHGLQGYFNQIHAHKIMGRWCISLPPVVTHQADYERVLCAQVGSSALTIAVGRRRESSACA
jgi:phosphopantetheinyl transferase